MGLFRRAGESLKRVHTLPDGRRARVIGNNLLVRMGDQPKTTRGGIIIPDTSIGSMHVTGEVLAVGWVTTANEPIDIPGLEVGDHVLFVKLLDKTDTNPQIKRIFGDNVIRIRPSDVLLVLDAEDVNRVQ
jgi:co-chaperonin GroES (HSP10)